MTNLAIKEDNEVLVCGEMVRFTDNYNIFGYEAKDNLGIIIRIDMGNGKPLVYLSEAGEFCEPKLEILERVKPGHVSKEAKDLLKNIRKLQVIDT